MSKSNITLLKRKFFLALANNSGAVVVEFALSLLFYFFIFLCFIQVVMIFIAHERLSFAAFVGARNQSVHGASQGIGSVSGIDQGASVKAGSDSIILEKRIEVPFDFNNIYSKGKHLFRIKQEFSVYKEMELGGDN